MYFRKLAKGDDCRTRLKGSDVKKLATRIEGRLKTKGYSCNADYYDWKNGKKVYNKSNFSLRGCRLNDKGVKKYGMNISPWSERFGRTRRGRVLNWNNWVEVNNTINEVMDEMNVCGKVDSLGGKFKVREGKRKYTEEDWENLAYENVGSEYYPMRRKDAWRSERN